MIKLTKKSNFTQAFTQAKNYNKIRTQKGVTLIELLIVIIIIGLLSTVIVLNLLPILEKSTREKAKNDIAMLQSALDQYRLDNFSYPTTNEGIESLIKPPSGLKVSENYRKGGYLQKKELPLDPWGNQYQYLNPGSKGEVDVFSYGSDGQSGGTGSSADIYGF